METSTEVMDLPIPSPDVWGQYGTAEAGRCTQWEPLIEALAPESGWRVKTMSQLMWKESRCDPLARSVTKDSGLLQINDRWLEPLTAEFGFVVDDVSIMHPVINIQAAAALCREWRKADMPCTGPWGWTDDRRN